MDYQAVWEDEETNRRVELVVDYSLEEAGVAINKITPKKVTFVDPESRDEVRSIRVWTESGRRILNRQFRSTPHFEAVSATISEQELAASV